MNGETIKVLFDEAQIANRTRELAGAVAAEKPEAVVGGT